jgi:hypothetical protein
MKMILHVYHMDTLNCVKQPSEDGTARCQDVLASFRMKVSTALEFGHIVLLDILSDALLTAIFILFIYLFFFRSFHNAVFDIASPIYRPQVILACAIFGHL